MWKYYWQISSDLVVPIARYGNLNWRVKKWGFQAANREYYIAKCVYTIVNPIDNRGRLQSLERSPTTSVSQPDT